MLTTRRRFLQVALGGAASLAAAPALWALVTGPGGDDGPPGIAYGRDRCEACGMVIGDARFAAAARVGSAAHRYDDIGCLVSHAGRDLASGRGRAFVHDTPGEAWIAATDAWYARSPEIRSPMNYGLAAFADPANARRAQAGIAPLTFDALLTAAATARS